MKGIRGIRKRVSNGILVLLLLALTIFTTSQSAYAHCDTLDGPVVKEARVAIDKGDITALLKWVRPSDEKELTAIFTCFLRL